jgi:hypothetical protein
VTSDLTAMAYLFVLYLLYQATIKSSFGMRFRVGWIVFQIWFAVALTALIVAPCFIAFTCLCDGTNCSYETGAKHACCCFVFF